MTHFTSFILLLSYSNIKEALSEFDPDIVIYNAGALYFYKIQITLGFSSLANNACMFRSYSEEYNL